MKKYLKNDDEPVELYRTSNDVVSRLAPIAEGAEVTLSLEGEEMRIEGNATSVEEMIYNLCDNAIKYNKRGGSVTVRVFSDGKSAVISISDTGIGIPKDKQERVFERFYRVDKSHSKAIGGTGLGLSIVKHAAAYHGATIELDSTEGVGTTVTVKFPFKKKILG